MKRAALIFAALAVAFTAPAAPVRTATENFVTNKIAAAIAAIPAPDYSPTNAELRATIEAVAPAPGDYAAVSNAAMNAASQTNDFLRLAGGGRIRTSEYDFIIGYDRLLAPRSGIWWQDLMAPCGIGCESLLGNLVFVSEGQWIWLPNKGGTLALRSDLADAATAATNAARAVTSAAISTNNEAFVEAVLAAPLAGASSGDLSEIGEYGSYGTIGAALLALIAGLAALKRRIGTAETAISGKAAAADLRYRIAEAAVRKTLPAGCFPVTFTYEGVSYSINELVKESEASAAGDMFIMVSENDYSLAVVESPTTGSELMSLIDVATFSTGGVFKTSGIEDLQFGGVSPVENTSPTLVDIQVLADRAENLITAQSGEAASIDIELPAPVEEPTGVRRARDFFLDVDNSANANDLALEFTKLGVTAGDGYAFVTDTEDSIGEIMTVGARERVRLYFTETPYVDFGNTVTIIHVARVTLGHFVTSTTTTQGGN